METMGFTASFLGGGGGQGQIYKGKHTHAHTHAHTHTGWPDGDPIFRKSLSSLKGAWEVATGRA